MKTPYFVIKILTMVFFYTSSMMLFASDVKAEPLKILVFTEGQTETMTKCGVSYNTLKYNAEAAIRYNRQLPVSNDADINAYINISALEIDSINCGVSFNLQFYKILLDSSLPDGKMRVVTGELCQNGGLLVYSKSRVQAALSDTLRSYVDECLARILK